MEMAVECNNQTCQFITFLCRLFDKIYIKTSQIMNKDDVKINCKYNGAKLTLHPLSVIYFARDPLNSYFDECQKKWNLFLNEPWKTHMRSAFRVVRPPVCTATEASKSLRHFEKATVG